MGFWNFFVNADLEVFGILRYRGFASFWHFRINADLYIICIFCNCEPESLLAYFCYLGPARFWNFYLNGDLRVFAIFCYRGPARLWQLSVTCEFFAFFRDRGPEILAFSVTTDERVFLEFPVTAKVRVFGIFTKMLIYAFLSFFREGKPGSLLVYFCFREGKQGSLLAYFCFRGPAGFAISH